MEGVIARIGSHAAILYKKGQMVRCQEEWKKCEWVVKMEGGHLLVVWELSRARSFSRRGIDPAELP